MKRFWLTVITALFLFVSCGVKYERDTSDSSSESDIISGAPDFSSEPDNNSSHTVSPYPQEEAYSGDSPYFDKGYIYMPSELVYTYDGDSGNMTFEYDENGWLSKVSGSLSVDSEYSYEKIGNAVYVTDSCSGEKYVIFDDNGTTTKLKDDAEDFAFEAFRDDKGRVITLEKEVTPQYFTELKYDVSYMKNGTLFKSSYVYEGKQNNSTTYYQKNIPIIIDDIGFQGFRGEVKFDNNGLAVEDEEYRYTYDNEQKLIMITSLDGNEEIDISYDKEDRIVSQTSNYDSKDREAKAISIEYEYDSNNNISNIRVKDGDEALAIEFKYEKVPLSVVGLCAFAIDRNRIWVMTKEFYEAYISGPFDFYVTQLY